MREEIEHSTDGMERSALPAWAEKTDGGQIRCTVCDKEADGLPLDHDCIYANDIVADGGVERYTQAELRILRAEAMESMKEADTESTRAYHRGRAAAFEALRAGDYDV